MRLWLIGVLVLCILGSAARAREAAVPGTHAGSGWVAQLRAWVAASGPVGPMVYALAYALATVLFVPGAALTLGAGATFGVGQGFLVVSVGATVGAGLAFLVGRHLARRRVQRWMERHPRFANVDRAVAQQGWKIVALMRLSPVFPFNLLNYACGITAIGFWPYLVASWIGMMPGILLYVYLGATTADVAVGLSGGGGGATAVRVVGLVATLAVTFVITRLARRAMAQEVPQ